MSRPLKENEMIKPPEHVAIIMDGNGRWANAHNLPRTVGHKKGVDAVRVAVESCLQKGIKVLTLYAFSSENWSRPKAEVNDLMALLRLYIKKEVKSLNQQGVRLAFIGRRDQLDADIIKLIEYAEDYTVSNEKMTLVIALNYGGRAEIVDAVRAITTKVKNGSVSVDDISEQMVSDALYTSEWVNPDLIIRTSGEKRLSNFMLWQAAYAEFVFLDIYWPDFTQNSFDDAIREFHQRDRRFGARNQG